MHIGILLIIIGIVISLFRIWQSTVLRNTQPKVVQMLLYVISGVIIISGIVNIILYANKADEVTKLRNERLILTDLKIKFEIVGHLTENAQVGHIWGSPLRLKIFSKKDTLLEPFYLDSPFEWNITALPPNQVKTNIFFSSHPEISIIGERIKPLEQYNTIVFPLGVVAQSMNIETTDQIIKIVQAIYINGIEIRRVEMPIGDASGNLRQEITEALVNEWFSRPFRNCEKEYLSAIKESSGAK